jgi:arylsulfatase A-like enzyme
MIKVPGKTQGTHTEAITEFIDIYPSLSELAGLEAPEHLDGQSFVPLMEGEARDQDYAISKYHDGVTLIQGDRFYTEFIDEKGNIQAKMFFDHSTDPWELDNLAEKPQYRGTVESMSKMLRSRWGSDFFLDQREPSSD